MIGLSDVDLPAGWARARLGDLGKYTNGRGFRKSEWSDTGRPIIRIQNLTGSAASFNYYAGNLEERHTVRAGDLLVSWAATLGAYLWRGPEAALNQHIFKVEPFIDRDFLRYLIDYKIQEILAAAHGSGMVHITRSRFDELPAAIPPLAEQHRIVEALEHHLSRLEAAMRAAAGAKRRLKPFSASVLDRTVLGTFTISAASSPSDASHHLLDGFASKRFDYAALPSLPVGWFWRRSSDVCEFICSGSTPAAHLMHPGNGDVPFLKVYNITQDGRVDFTNKPTYIDRETHEHPLKRSRVRPGDVLTNIVGPPLGKTAVVPDLHPEWNMNQAIVAFRAGPDVHPEWLALALRSPFILGMLQKTAKATAGQFNIALSTCRELPLPVPPMNEQLDLVARSAELLEVTRRSASQLALISLRSRHLRQAILRQAFAGKLVPQNPSDEPASVLLDQISARDGKTKRSTRHPRKTAAVRAASPPPSMPSIPAPTNAVQQELPL
ncbi:restriction endonuclease subunit S [Micromonospora sp. STR1_7]|uniref:Restriction endonuclease subunit S n=1 Tax=Micromonospora parastrephiae TaxID=2806101 RepID=A0ABS1XQD1_9ACTN|nr:restriction endonuclease subunit S [Micromonospora parastrephiae]MBM0231453.1 restriction endonuclease subunit S [Micromonospora parastrephiae]